MYSRNDVSQNQFNSFTSTSTEIISIDSNLYVSMSIDVLEHFLKQVEAALHTGQYGMGYLALFVILELLLYVSKNNPNHLYDGYNESSKGE